MSSTSHRGSPPTPRARATICPLASENRLIRRLLRTGVQPTGLALSWRAGLKGKDHFCQALENDVFTLHGSLAFALVLAAWMYADVPATNVLAPDRQRVMAAIDDPVLLRRLLYAKNIVLWTFITPVCAVIALVTGISGHDLLSTLYTVIWIGVVPFGALGISAWVGILFPYHPMPLRFRWEHRRPRGRMLWRWLTLAVTPYVLVPWLAVALMTPSLLLWGFTSVHGLSAKLPDCSRSLKMSMKATFKMSM